MKAHSISSILACIAILTVTMPMLGQAPTAPPYTTGDDGTTVTRGQNPKPRAAGERARDSHERKRRIRLQSGRLKISKLPTNGVPQKIADLDFGHTSLSMVLLWRPVRELNLFCRICARPASFSRML